MTDATFSPNAAQPHPQHIPRLFVKQRITAMVNRYEIRTANPDGSEGEIIAMAQQKRLAFKEQVTFYADEARTQPVFSFKARQRMDIAATYDVLDADGTPIGSFQKDFKASLLRSSFHFSGPGFEAYGQERNHAIAIIRRFVDLPFSFHFDFTDKQSGEVVLSSERQFSLRDRYTVDVRDQRIDYRLAAAMAVGLDALLQR
ncbi:hypothetical protein [Labedella endophytica]|jgi:uncharacterized protein YxjI|uniref:Uncharacterized protein n=1 Tax=Labedella endophytica TaxID=1523160 RepID=A0A433JUY8_9MICO|nr:hypothetical protein [Labedella endophytica]RUR01872.1 hypothetical protein ELQ94_10510 [Labedella endophytica]